MTENIPRLPHSLSLQERSRLEMTGVSEVVSFDEGAVILHTELGTLIIEGEQLQLKTLLPEGGQVRVDGQISSLHYEQSRDMRSFWRRLTG